MHGDCPRARIQIEYFDAGEERRIQITARDAAAERVRVAQVDGDGRQVVTDQVRHVTRRRTALQVDVRERQRRWSRRAGDIERVVAAETSDRQRGHRSRDH